MSKVAIVYWSGTGNTAAMAHYVSQGVKEAGAEVDVFTSEEFTPDLAAGYEKLAFGCPSMGSEVLEESEFEPMFESVKGSLGGKVIALFGSYGWGDGEWMRNWEDDCRSLGCRMAADPVIVCGTPDDAGAAECAALGKALAEA